MLKDKLEKIIGDIQGVAYLRKYLIKKPQGAECLQKLASEEWHDCKTYYLIYNGGSDLFISIKDILCGDKFPKTSDIIYAEMYSDMETHVDTEIGDLTSLSDAELDKHKAEVSAKYIF